MSNPLNPEEYVLYYIIQTFSTKFIVFQKFHATYTAR